VSYKSRRSRRNWIIAACVILVAAMLMWQFWPWGSTSTAPDANSPSGRTDANEGAGQLATGGGQDDSSDANTTTPQDPVNPPVDPNDGTARLQPVSTAMALTMVSAGEKLLAEKKFAEGRALLSKALLSGNLGEATAETVRGKLEDLAEKMIFSRQIFDGDPYTLQYTFASGEVLVRVERKLALHVPTQILLKINGIARAETIRAGQMLKVIQGPFHAIVDKSDFTMDIFLHRKGCEPAYVKRLRVGLGKNGSTPVGLWRLRLGSKRNRAPWFPPPSADVQRSIQWGEPGYPLGKMGYWIGLEGIDENTSRYEGYGIHGTNDPSSIGRAASLGCIRLADADIDLVFSLLYEKWSTVSVRP